MMGMIVLGLVMYSIQILIQVVQYGLMAFVIARAVRYGWKGK